MILNPGEGGGPATPAPLPRPPANPVIQRPEYSSQVPTVARPEYSSQVPSPAQRDVWKASPALQEKDTQTGRALIPYTYEVSGPELQRLRTVDPQAASEVTTQLKTVPLTWEAYDKLPPAQRAAVDFNSLLVEAREADLKFKGQYSEAQQEQYQKDVEAMFGSAGGSDTIGYHTVNLLKEINFSAVGQDLDEFLSLERGINVDELKSVALSRADIDALSNFEFRGEGQRYRVGDEEAPLRDNVGPEKPTAMSEQGAKAYSKVRSPGNMMNLDTRLLNDMLNTYRARLRVWEGEPWSIQSALGLPSKPGEKKTPPGYGTGSVDQALMKTYELLKLNPNETGMNAVFAAFEQGAWTQEYIQMLWDYTNERSLREIQYQDDSDAQKLRDLLGWK